LHAKWVGIAAAEGGTFRQKNFGTPRERAKEARINRFGLSHGTRIVPPKKKDDKN